MNEISEEDALWLALLSGIVFLTYTYHLYRSAKLWRRERTYRSIRAFFIAVMLQLGLFRIALGAMLRAYPEATWLVTLNNFAAPILYVMLLSGGVLLGVAWILDDRAAKRAS